MPRSSLRRETPTGEPVAWLSGNPPAALVSPPAGLLSTLRYEQMTNFFILPRDIPTLLNVSETDAILVAL